jgi:hypothetical protein
MTLKGPDLNGGQHDLPNRTGQFVRNSFKTNNNYPGAQDPKFQNGIVDTLSPSFSFIFVRPAKTAW